MIYGLPIEKKFPLNNEEEINKVIFDFNTCHKIKRKMLADNINRELLKRNMVVNIPQDSDFKNYIDKSCLAGITDNIYNRVCTPICEINYDGVISLYNKKVFEEMVRQENNYRDTNDYTSFLRSANEYADQMILNDSTVIQETKISMEIVSNIIRSLTVSILSFSSSSETYVKKLLDDLEEFMLLYTTTEYYMMRRILEINVLATRVGIKNDINRMIGIKTQQLLNKQTSIYNQLKLSSGYMKHRLNKDNSHLISFLKDKKMELQSYVDLQYGYFLSGDQINYRKHDYNMYENENYLVLECTQDKYLINHLKNKVLKKYPKLSLDIDYSNFFRLRTKYKYCKQVSVDNTVLTIVVLNKEAYIVCKSDLNTLYLIKYTDVSFPICVEGEKNSVKIKAIKVTFKNKTLNGEIDRLLEQSMKFM